MAASEAASAVLDAGPIIHLDELGCLDLLEGLGDLNVPEVVWAEVRRHRPLLRESDVPKLKVVRAPGNPSVALSTLIRALELDTGEIAALDLLEKAPGSLFLCDDAAARLAAGSLGFRVHGTVGLIIRAIRRGTRTPAQTRAMIEEIPARSTLHISRRLLREIVQLLPDR
jgi:predicted nucleic acid-binding protein